MNSNVPQQKELQLNATERKPGDSTKIHLARDLNLLEKKEATTITDIRLSLYAPSS